MEGILRAICISERKGEVKHRVPSAVLREGHGLEGDAHAGNWHRQVSILSLSSIEGIRNKGIEADFGAFGENLVFEGAKLDGVDVGSRIELGGCELKVTQLGKACHSHCAIYEQTGECIMPKEGIFAVVTAGGRIDEGIPFKIYPPEPDRPFSAAVITLSDRCYRGENEDKSGPLITEMLKDSGYEVMDNMLLPDGREKLEAELINYADRRRADVIFTTGGTGFSERDVTPEATEAVCDRMAPGIGEGLRNYSFSITPKAMFSRQTAGIRKRTLIINLPGSPKACREELEYLLPVLPHALEILRGTVQE
ncbi:MAG: molybdenum cofactor biosynthesis protein [Lachnospiraceae bacterium]|nr:molybdenum cofactor biosynthesis protein [Lachnospiraceae bacterium]